MANKIQILQNLFMKFAYVKSKFFSPRIVPLQLVYIKMIAFHLKMEGQYTFCFCVGRFTVYFCCFKIFKFFT